MLEQRIQVEVENRFRQINEKIKEDRDFVKETIGLSFKIGGGFLAICVGILTFVGYQHLSGIDEQIQRAVEVRVAQVNPLTTYKTELQAYESTFQTVSGFSLVNTYDLQFADANSPFDDNTITQTDIKRITRLLSDKDTEDKLFYAASKLMYSTDHDGNQSAFNKSILRLAMANEDTCWLRKDPDRWEEIIRLGRNRHLMSLGPTARSIMLDASLPDNVRAQAIEFAASVRDAGALVGL